MRTAALGQLAGRARPQLLVPWTMSMSLGRTWTTRMTSWTTRLAFSASSSASSSSPSGPPVYKTKKVWPPDFTRLSPQEQLRFEKRFKRRVALRAERPRWIKFIKLAQYFSITFIVIYCVLFMEWKGPTPFDGIRAYFWSTLGMLHRGPQGALKREGGDGEGGSRGAATTAKPRTEVP